MNCSSDLNIFANSRPSALNFQSVSRSLEQFFLTVGQNNFGNKRIICFFYPQKGVAYISRKSDKLGKQQNVDSPHSCQEICAETPNCLYWTWLEKKKRKKVKQICKLRSGVRKSGFRRQKDKAVSGTPTPS